MQYTQQWPPFGVLNVSEWISTLVAIFIWTIQTHRGSDQPDDVHVSICAGRSLPPLNVDSYADGGLLHSAQLLVPSRQEPSAGELVR